MDEDAHGLTRFRRAQGGGIYERALAELRAGRKTGHWIWFIFPQIAGLGQSPTSRLYALASVQEARAYLNDPVLGPRLDECARALLGHVDRSAEEVLGGIDAIKLRSSMTLFARAAPEDPVFLDVLAAFYDGAPDAATDRLLGSL
jgi:uncharacterized protein (DUF1810 family)